MNHLRRNLAPVSTEAWAAIDEEVRRALPTFLSARRLVDFSGPHGWQLSTVDTGHVAMLHEVPGEQVHLSVRRSLPLTELRRPFELSWTELEAIDRGATAVDLQAAVEAARSIALVEDALVFHGMSAASIDGIVPASTHETISLDPDLSETPRAAAEAVSTLRRSGVDGPYAMALGSRCYTGVVESTHGGYPVVEHLRLILDGGPVVWAPAVDGAIVLSTRGGDFELVVGEDFSIGYKEHSDRGVSFVLEETMLFRVNGPEAAVPLGFETTSANGRGPGVPAGDWISERA